LLAQVTNLDVSDEVFRFLDVKIDEVGLCDAIIQRVSYTGDLGYEIYVNSSQVVSLYQTLNEAGLEFGLKPFGMRAMMSLRLEKGFGSWLREFSPDYTPLETGLDRFVSYEKQADFIGKEAAVAEKQKGASRRLTTFVVGVEDTDVNADEPIWQGDKLVGFVTSGGYAHWSQKSVAIGFVPPEMIIDGADFEIEILGEKRPAKIITRPLLS
jgi:dimethylglycine dehydrogenase